MTQNKTWGFRLLLERDRLGYSKMEGFARAFGVTERTLYNYTSEQTPLDINFLIKFACLGGDVQFLVTGIRSENLNDVKQSLKVVESQSIESQRTLLLRQIQQLVEITMKLDATK